VVCLALLPAAPADPAAQAAQAAPAAPAAAAAESAAIEGGWMRGDSCGVDLGPMRAACDSLPLAGVPDSTADLYLAGSFRVAARLLGPSTCLRGCIAESTDVEARAALECWQHAALRYARIGGRERAARALLEMALIHAGPDLWEEGIRALVRLPTPAQVPPDSVPPAPGWFTEHSWSDVRFDLALQQALAECPDSIRQRFEGGRRPHPIWLEQIVLRPAEALAETDLSAYVEAHGVLPPEVADAQGRPLPEIFPSLFSGECPSEIAGELGCWFEGWPGFRIASYAHAAKNCILSIRGAGIPQDDIWGFWYP
jgi:hypothetical protein